jgi:hypothetical protein
MARKKLLTEGEIRQFMKLANLRPIGNGRLKEMYEVPGARDEEDELRDELGATEDELGAEDELAGDEGAELDAMDMEMAPEEEAGGGMVSMDDFMTALEQAIEEVTGEEADVSEEPGEEGGEEDVDMEMDMEMGPEGGEELEMGAEEEMVAEIVRRLREDEAYSAKKEKPGEDIRKGAKERGAEGTKKKTSGKGRGKKKGDDAYVNEDQIVAEVAKRVASRLHRESRKEQVVDHLAERIMKRLTK